MVIVQFVIQENLKIHYILLVYVLFIKTTQKKFLDLSEVINILNGKYSFKKVYNFIESSLKLRNLIVNEFDPQ